MTRNEFLVDAADIGDTFGIQWANMQPTIQNVAALDLCSAASLLSEGDQN